MRYFLRFIIPLFLAIGLIAYAVVPLVDNLMVQWFVRDLDLRSKLISSAVDDAIACPAAGSGALASQVIQEPKGPLHVAFHTVQGSGRVLGHLALVHDMSFVQRRSETTKQYIMYLFLIVGIVVATVTMFIAWLSWRGWIAGTRALLRSNGLRHPLAPGTRPE